MFSICCGEGGMSPEYFWHHLTFCEANLYIKGLSRRYHNGWEQARLVSDVTAKCAGNKGGSGITFPWEKEEVHEVSQADIDYLNEVRKKREAMFNKK